MERNYVIPLRRAFQKVPTYRKAEKAVSATKKFLIKHMKVENVKLGRHLNMELWKNGPRNPPHKVEVNVELIKDKEDGDYAYAELVGIEKEQLKFEKVVKKEGLAGKLESVVGTKKDPKKEDEKKVKKEVLEKGKDKKAEKVQEVKDEKKEVLEAKRTEKIVKKDDKKSVKQ